VNNAFEFGKELGTEKLVDRQDKVAEVVQTIQQGASCFSSPRPFGKTSRLKRPNLD
jgi:hypothetical protein